MVLKQLFGSRKADPSETLYAAIVAAARQEKFYADWHVPDTLDGRFDMMVLHMFLTLDRLRAFGAQSEQLRQALTDRFFAGMDAALREIGVGDLSVGKKVRKMAEAFYGRVAAYNMALAKPGDDLRDALARNVFAEADATHADELAVWTVQARNILAEQDYETLAKGRLRFE